jgi:hypothetical protein
MRRIFLLPIILVFGCVQINMISTVSDVGKVAWDLPRHNNFVYINQNAIDQEFFAAAEKNLNNGYVYLVLSSTGSPAANLISAFTGQEYAHTSLAFDEELQIIVSYNGGNGVAEPGMNKEIVEHFHQKPDAKLIVYRLKATKDQKRIILNEIRRINNAGSSYNILGLFLPFKIRENIMYCSQFVYTVLKAAELDYFEISPEKVQPIDFIIRDTGGKLEFCRKIALKDWVDVN